MENILERVGDIIIANGERIRKNNRNLNRLVLDFLQL